MLLKQEHVCDRDLERLLDVSAGFPFPELVWLAASLFIRDGDLRPALYATPMSVRGRTLALGSPVRLAAASAYSQTPDAVASDDSRAEGRDFLVQVSGGVVGCRMVDHERQARSAARGHLSRALARWSEDGQLVEWLVPTPHRVITQWSRRSRARMTRRLSELDYAPMFASGRVPAMITLTYPGAWQEVAPSGKATKRHLQMLWRRWSKAWGVAPPVLWKLEFQRRGAPHLHLFAVPEAGRVLCRCPTCVVMIVSQHAQCRVAGVAAGLCDCTVNFRTWLSHTWADVVAHPDPEQRRRHVLAGTGIDYREGLRARDPKRLAVYFSKHGGAAGSKEYQHKVPLEWQHPERGPGRFWGYRGLKPVRAEVYVAQDTYLRVRRTLRRLSRSKRLIRTARVPRVQTATGVITWRTVHRPLVHLDHGGMAGGFLLVNDGPALASALSRLH